ncbi:hypothetical protein CN200_02570 [Sinorhizobium meliloti]|nr:hypothetical protein CN229_33260 [Sinorhizobium meliloti]RVG34968.1 hypothetical protein CN233_10205 [Sinorhizobium meliloti]RVI19702.1 hypothetical protein CN200_02570 [Sinorhizobium meliloti]RVI81664.1 hypothetical protein CN191_09080 [Sinorhizobium meliloti]RVK87285.1 hypothetical protein CN152_33445 [Sinorhizobium meliloti]
MLSSIINGCGDVSPRGSRACGRAHGPRPSRPPLQCMRRGDDNRDRGDGDDDRRRPQRRF